MKDYRTKEEKNVDYVVLKKNYLLCEEYLFCCNSGELATDITSADREHLSLHICCLRLLPSHRA